MSMYWAGYEVLGMVLYKEDIEYFKEKYIKKHQNEFECKTKEEMMETMDECLDCSEVFNGCNGDDIFFIHINDDYCEGALFYQMFNNNGKLREKYKYINCGGNDIYVLEAFYGCHPINVFGGNFYKEAEDIIIEMKSRMIDYLPEDFPYAERIGTVTYAAYA